MSEMSENINNIVEWLMYEQQNIFAVAIIGSGRNIVFQTDNWDVSPNLGELNQLIAHNPGGGSDEYYSGVSKPPISSITISDVKYLIVESTSERKVGTNPGGQGHLLICPVPAGGPGALVCYVSPEIGPRDALIEVENYALKLIGLI
jgi:hypothetical protein